MCRAEARYTPDQEPIFSLHTKPPSAEPSDVNKLAAEKVQVTPNSLCPSHRRDVASLSAIKLRVRNVRRLQLVFLNLFNEHIQLDMHYKASSPRRNQYNPV